MLVARPPGCHTDVGVAGKTSGPAGSKQGMTTHPSHPTYRCSSPGPPVDVRAWRTCRLLEAGFPRELATSLAGGHVDLHALLQLIDAGCPPELAARILSPLDEPAVLP
ncbi:hypothetical protein GCM10027517_33410 [Phycicoccus ginsengisoli]